MCEYEEETKAKLLTRDLLEDYSNRCARLEIYPPGSSEYVSLWTDLWCEAEEYESLSNYNRILKGDGKEGIINDFFNHCLVPPIFDQVVSSIGCGHHYIVVNDGKYGIVDDRGKGHLVCPCMYDCIEHLQEFSDLLKIEQNGKYGILEVYGNLAEETVAPLYDDIQSSEGGFVLLKKDHKFGLYKYGYLLEPAYERIFVPSILGWVKVQKDGVWGYIDVDNEFTEDMSKAYLCYCVNG